MEARNPARNPAGMGGAVGDGPAEVGVLVGGFAASTVEILLTLKVSSNKRSPTRLIVRRADLGIACSSGILLSTEHHFKLGTRDSDL